MKAIKKSLAILLALCMAVALMVPALADDVEPIIIDENTTEFQDSYDVPVIIKGNVKLPAKVKFTKGLTIAEGVTSIILTDIVVEGGLTIDAAKAAVTVSEDVTADAMTVSAAAEITLAAPVPVTITGTVTGDVTVAATAVAKDEDGKVTAKATITVADDAEVKGAVEVNAPVAVTVAEKAAVKDIAVKADADVTVAGTVKGELSVAKDVEKATVTTTETSEVNTLTQEGGADITLGGKVTEVVQEDTASGSLKQTETSEVGKMELNSADSEVSLAGKTTELEVNNADAVVNVEEGAAIDKATAVEGAEITGEGAKDLEVETKEEQKEEVQIPATRKTGAVKATIADAKDSTKNTNGKLTGATVTIRQDKVVSMSELQSMRFKPANVVITAEELTALMNTFHVTEVSVIELDGAGTVTAHSANKESDATGKWIGVGIIYTKGHLYFVQDNTKKDASTPSNTPSEQVVQTYDLSSARAMTIRVVDSKGENVEHPDSYDGSDTLYITYYLDSAKETSSWITEVSKTGETWSLTGESTGSDVATALEGDSATAQIDNVYLVVVSNEAPAADGTGN